MSSKWQAAQDPADRERQAAATKFVYDGKVVANSRILGKWKTLGVVKTIDEFTPDKRLNARGAQFAAITFKRNGETDDVTRLWSGDTLMDLVRYEARRTIIKKIDQEDYLFVEVGGFSAGKGATWQSPWYVLKR